MSEILTPSFEAPESWYEQQLSQIEAQYGDLNFDEFEAILAEQDEALQQQIFSIFEQYGENNDFQDYIDYEELPYSLVSLQELIDNFPINNVRILWENEPIVEGDDMLREDIRNDAISEIEDRTAEIEDRTAEIEDRTAEIEDRTAEIEDSREEIISELSLYLSEKFNEDIPTDFEWAKEYIEENYIRLLQQAQQDSDETFVEVYQRFNTLSDIGISLDLSAFTPAYNEAVLRLTPPETIVGPVRETSIEAALGDSAIVDIDGDIIRGENGEVIELFGDSVSLSLEWEDGLLLEVGEIERIDTKADEIAIEWLERERNSNLQEIQNNSQKIIALEWKLGHFQSEWEEFYEREEIQDEIATQFAALSPRTGIVERIEQGISGAELKELVINFFQEKIDAFTQRNEELEARNEEINWEIGILGARIQSERRRATERIEKAKERVRQSQHLLESMGVSRVIANASEIFPRITEQNPVYLPNGDIITGVNFSTLELEWSFSPALWEWGAEDARTREVIMQLMNLALTWDATWPMEVTGTWNIRYRFDWENEYSDKMEFDSFVSEIAGRGTFESMVNDHIFSWWREDNK